MKIINFIVPCYNEERNILKFINSLQKHISKENYKFKITFIDDGSKDQTWNEIKRIKKTHSKTNFLINGYRFLNNCGKEAVIKFGIKEIKNFDSTVIIDADLQHPPSIIPKMIRKWEEGYLIVNAVRKSIDYSIFRKIGSLTFNFLMKKIASIDDLNNQTDFKLLDKKTINYLNEYKERIRYFKAIVNNLQIKKTNIYFNAERRKEGLSKFNLISLLSLGFNAIFAYSIKPLKIIGLIGIIIMILSLSIFIYIISSYLFLNINYSFTTVIVVLNTFLFGFLISILGIISYYISIVYIEIISRPEILINEKI